MADFTFDCPSCKQAIQCDDAWSGHQIQCPICQAALIVPANTPPPPPPPPPAKHGSPKEVAHLGQQLVAVPKGGTKLATALSTNVARSSFGAGKRFEKKEVKKRSPVVTLAIVLAVVVVLGAAGYIAYPYIQNMLGKGSSEPSQAEKPAGGKKGGEQGGQTETAASTTPGADAAAAAPADAAPAQPVVNTNAIIAPKWTLDVKKAEIPDGRANGLIAGTNFVYEGARLDRSAASSYALSLRQGKGLTPDRGVVVYLRLNPGEIPTNKTWTVSEDMKGTTVTKLWKTDPRYEAKKQNFLNGYAMKLELGSMSEAGTVSGKLYLALPDNEHSVVAGNFTASTASANAQPGYDAAAQAQPTAAESAETAAQRQRFQQRYGIKK